jgi:hypothetical protein
MAGGGGFEEELEDMNEGDWLGQMGLVNGLLRWLEIQARHGLFVNREAARGKKNRRLRGRQGMVLDFILLR